MQRKLARAFTIITKLIILTIIIIIPLIIITTIIITIVSIVISIIIITIITTLAHFSPKADGPASNSNPEC